MPVWGQLNLQKGSTFTIELLNYFHDYIILFLVLIVSFVAYLFVYKRLSIYSFPSLLPLSIFCLRVLSKLE